MDFGHYFKQVKNPIVWGIGFFFVLILYVVGLKDIGALAIFFLLIPIGAPFAGPFFGISGGWNEYCRQYRELFPSLSLWISIPLGAMICLALLLLEAYFFYGIR